MLEKDPNRASVVALLAIAGAAVGFLVFDTITAPSIKRFSDCDTLAAYLQPHLDSIDQLLAGSPDDWRRGRFRYRKAVELLEEYQPDSSEVRDRLESVREALTEVGGALYYVDGSGAAGERLAAASAALRGELTEMVAMCRR